MIVSTSLAVTSEIFRRSGKGGKDQNCTSWGRTIFFQIDGTLLHTHTSIIDFQTNMIRSKTIVFIATCCAWFVASSLNAAMMAAGTILSVSTESSISSQDPVDRIFAVKINEDVAVKGTVLLRAGTKAFGKVQTSRANPRKSEPLSLELTWISVNGRNVAVKTDAVQPAFPVTTGQQARYRHTAATLILSPGTKFQFRLAQAVTW
jgi:hypothetical protein